MVLGGFVGGFGSFWVVLGRFGWFWLVPCFSNYEHRAHSKAVVFCEKKSKKYVALLKRR